MHFHPRQSSLVDAVDTYAQESFEIHTSVAIARSKTKKCAKEEGT